MKITDYPSKTMLEDGDSFIFTGSSGTKHITTKDLANELFRLNGIKLNNVLDIFDVFDELYMAAIESNISSSGPNRPSQNNPIFSKLCVYRGKYLGDSFTDEQLNTIVTNRFKDLFIGDYWFDNAHNVKWIIVDFNYWKGVSDSPSASTDPVDYKWRSHIVIMPSTPLYNAQMNNTATTVNGYIGTLMRSNNLIQALTWAENFFGAENINQHRECICNAVTNGMPSGMIWTTTKIEIPSIYMFDYKNVNIIPGTIANGNFSTGSITASNRTLRFFKMNDISFLPRSSYWMRDVANNTAFFQVQNTKLLSYLNANNSLGVLPIFGVGNFVA